MTNFVRVLNIGKAKVTIINIGDIYLPLAQYMNIPDEERAKPDGLMGLAEQTRIPIHSIHIQLPETSILVDAGVYDVVTEPEYAIPDYVPPPSLMHQLAEQGIPYEGIEHVIITHRHWDHFNGTTTARDGVYVPQFPNATYYLGEQDWARVQTAFEKPDSVESRTFKVLHEQGVLELVAGNLDLGNGVYILSAPGETAGHQIVRVHSAGETIYCLGDLYHHPVEFAHPEWKVQWANGEMIAPSRQMLTQRAIADKALLVATHIPEIGRLITTTDGVAWESVG